jgi:hypothetical protein
VDCLAARRETGCRGRFIRRLKVLPQLDGFSRWLLTLRFNFSTGRRTCDSRMGVAWDTAGEGGTA